MHCSLSTELPEGEDNLGEADTSYPLSLFVDKIEWLLGVQPGEYERMRIRMRERAIGYAIGPVMQRFLDALTNAQAFQFRFPASAHWHHWADLWRWRFLKRIGVRDPLENRYLAKPYRQPGTRKMSAFE